MALVDEYFFEHHVRNKVMITSIRGRPTKQTDLHSWYVMVTAARKQGLRMHFWP